MRRTRIAAAMVMVAAGLAAVGGAGIAQAAPSAPNADLDKSTLDLFAGSCDGQEVQTLSTPFATFWIGDQKYVFTEATVTFGDEVLFSKEWGARTGLGEAIHCEGDFEDGSHWVVKAVAVPRQS